MVEEELQDWNAAGNTHVDHLKCTDYGVVYVPTSTDDNGRRCALLEAPLAPNPGPSHLVVGRVSTLDNHCQGDMTSRFDGIMACMFCQMPMPDVGHSSDASRVSRILVSEHEVIRGPFCLSCCLSFQFSFTPRVWCALPFL